MSLLIQMRQRMKAVETIKKITHAMRLISMSAHSRLRTKQRYLEEYKKGLHTLFAHVHQQANSWSHDILFPPATSTTKLCIIVGSQKGLVGNFNAQLYFFFERELAKMNKQDLQIITIGKKMSEYCKVTYGSVIKEFDEFSFNNLDEVSRAIAIFITEQKNPFAQVSIFSNYPKTFFTQQPRGSQLIPFQALPSWKSNKTQDIIFQQDPKLILDRLADQLIYISIQESLFLSLVSEQAARFVAMDSSTRNAKTLLETMQLNYNKLRQTKITRELTDLAGSFF